MRDGRYWRLGTTRSRLLLILSACIVQLLQTSCIVLPIPYTVVQHGIIRGRVIDDDTGRPVSGVLVYVNEVDGEPDATTDPEGNFCIAEKESWQVFCTVPLVPFDPLLSQSVNVVYPGLASKEDGGRIYRSLTIGVQSYRPTRIVGDRGKKNRGLDDDLGTIRLKTCPRMQF